MKTIGFGISVTQKEELSFLQKTSSFSAVELPGELLECCAETLPLMANRFLLQVAEVIPRKILDAITETSVSVRQEILCLFQRRCETMARCGISRATLAPDLLRLLQEPAFFAAESSFLRSCFGIAHREKIRLALELRIPGALAEKAVQFLRLKERFLYPLETVLDFHPHEPEALRVLEPAAKALPFERGCWRLSFDAGAGNYPGKELLQRILPEIHSFSGTRALLFFAPGTGQNGEIFASVQELCRTLDAEAGEGKTR